MTKIVPIDQEVKKESPSVVDQKVMGAMVEMLSGLDQRLSDYFDEQDQEKPKPDEEKAKVKRPPKDLNNPNLIS